MQECVLCEEYITNPLCPDCIADQVSTWLREVKPELVEELRKETKKLTLSIFNENKCIKCKGFMDICTYCYTEHVFYWLKSQETQSDATNEFVKFFHFDLERKGYSKSITIN